MTDQPPMGGGEASAPTPFSVFLASIGTCAGIYVLGFCRQRGISTDGIRIVQRASRSSYTGMIDKIELEIQVPASFPEKYMKPWYVPPTSALLKSTWKIHPSLRSIPNNRLRHYGE